MPFRPGLTGAATLVFRREEEMLQDVSDDDLEVYYCRMIKPLKSKIDWEYMSEATLASDLALLYKTARCSSRPAPALGRWTFLNPPGAFPGWTLVCT